MTLNGSYSVEQNMRLSQPTTKNLNETHAISVRNVAKGPRSHIGRGDLGDWVGYRNPQSKFCIANCGQTVKDSGTVTTNILQQLNAALSNGTIANPIRLLLPLTETASFSYKSTHFLTSCVYALLHYRSSFELSRQIK